VSTGGLTVYSVITPFMKIITDWVLTGRTGPRIRLRVASQQALSTVVNVSTKFFKLCSHNHNT
jgi:hypothetical protein